MLAWRQPTHLKIFLSFFGFIFLEQIFTRYLDLVSF